MFSVTDGSLYVETKVWDVVVEEYDGAKES